MAKAKKPATRIEVEKSGGVWWVDLFVLGLRQGGLETAEGHYCWKTKAAALRSARKFAAALGDIPVIVVED